MTAPCACAAKWAHVACSCPWRDHLTKPLRVEVGWLYDTGRVVHDATLSGLVYPDNTVDDMILTLDDGDEVEVPREDVQRALDDLRSAADDLWRSCA